MCSSFDFKKTLISSKYKIDNFHRMELRTISIARLNRPGSFSDQKTCGPIGTGRDSKRMRSCRRPASRSVSASSRSCNVGY